MAGQRLEWRAGGVGRELIIAGDDPHFAGLLDAHLSGAEDVAGGVKRDTRIAECYGLAVIERLDGGVGAQARAEECLAGGSGEVGAGAGTCVVGVGMGHDGAVYGAPGVDVEIARGAVEAVRGELEEGHPYYYFPIRASRVACAMGW